MRNGLQLTVCRSVHMCYFASFKNRGLGNGARHCRALPGTSVSASWPWVSREVVVTGAQAGQRVILGLNTGIRAAVSTAFHPWADGQTKRLSRILEGTCVTT